MNISAAIAKKNAIRAALSCAIFCAAALCPAQETARGIVAEKIGGTTVERPDPEIRFVKDAFGWELLAVSSDLKFIVFFDCHGNYKFNAYQIVDFTTGYVLRTINLDHKEAGTVGIAEDNNYIQISYDDEVYIYSVETGQQISVVNQHFTYFGEIDAENEIPSFIDDKELYEVFKSHRHWLRDDEKNLYIFYDWEDCVVLDVKAKRKYSFSFNIKEAYCKVYIDEYKGNDFMSVAAAYYDGHIIRYSIQGEVLTTYSFDSTDYIRIMKQQDELLIAYCDEKIYVYDLYSGKILKQCYNYFITPSEADELYYNFEENYIIQMQLHDFGEYTLKIDLKSEDSYIDPSFDKNYPLFDHTDFINLNNTIYFLTFDNNLETIIVKWNHLNNTAETVKTGLFFSDIPSFKCENFSYFFDYNQKNNMLYATFLENKREIIQCILKCNLTTNECSLYYPKNEWRYADLLFTNNFDTAFFSNYDFSNRAMVNLKDFTLIESSDFLEEKVNDYCYLRQHEYICALTARNTICRYNSMGECIAEYANQEEYRKSKDYQPFHYMTNSGVTRSDFYGELYHVQFVQGGESLIYTPEGFFCGSEWATKNLVYILDGMDVIGIDQVYDTYYRPDLVAAKIRGEDISSYASAVQLASLVRSGRAPAVSLSGIPAESSGRDMTFGVCVRNTGGGIGAVNLLLNGKAIRLSDGVASADGETVEFRHTVTLQNGSNTLEAFALNGAGLVESVRSSAEVVWRGATEKPDLYVLTAAVNRYRDKSLWLNFAVPDAQAVAEGFQKQQSGLYRSVHVFRLNDGDVTKENLAAEFSRLSEKIRADDVFVFFVSGHGTTYDDGDYYYLPSDFRYTSKDSIPAGGISKNDLLTNLSKIKAGKTLVMLDTCNSGAFVSDIGQRGLSEKTAIDRLTRATGHATLAASSDTQAAMEGYNGHGVFTYVFLEGIAGAADSDGDGYVTLNELSAFVEREVPERSYEKWGYEQVPQKDLRRQDFPIAGK